MNKKMIVTSAYFSSLSATVMGISLALLAEDPQVIARGSAAATILGVFGISCFFLALIAKD